MKKLGFFQFVAISGCATVVLLTGYFFAVRAAQKSGFREVKNDFVMFVTRIVESDTFPNGVARYLHYKQDTVASGLDLWVVAENGDLLASSTTRPIPAAWKKLPRPRAVHEYTSQLGMFTELPSLVVVRLDSPVPTYLVMSSEKQAPYRRLAVGRALSMFLVVGLAIFLSLLLTSFYLRQKSKQARVVLSRLEKGELDARFEIKRFDEVGSLMLDFNRMAAEIERLVKRLKEMETARTTLLSELSHDLRTPLTSVRASVETLLTHHAAMPKAQQLEFLTLMQGELTYFIKLIENLFFIADLGEPRYQGTTQLVDLGALVEQEIKGRALSRPQLEWKVEIGTPLPGVRGDFQLLQRLVKNALDNASRYAAHAVKISAHESGGALKMIVEGRRPRHFAGGGGGVRPARGAAESRR